MELLKNNFLLFHLLQKTPQNQSEKPKDVFLSKGMPFAKSISLGFWRVRVLGFLPCQNPQGGGGGNLFHLPYLLFFAQPVLKPAASLKFFSNNLTPILGGPFKRRLLLLFVIYLS